MKPIVIIPARGGSKGIPGKNIKPLNGKPLIQYTIEAAREVFPDKNIIVSTDSNEIKKVVEETGLTVPFLRPAELSTDTSSSYDVLIHATEYAKSQGIDFDTVVLLQPTSPLRNSKHISEALSIYNDEFDMVVSVKESEENPYYSLFEEDEKGLLRKSKSSDYTRRQDCPPVYSYNGAIYIINYESLKKQPLHKFTKISKYLMPEINSLDLDTELDWKFMEFLLESKSV